jgi:hypothetical protein
MSKRKRNKALTKRHVHKVNPDDLHPSIAAGLTQGASAEEAQQHLGKITPVKDGADIARELARTPTVDGSRVPLPRFTATTTDTGFVRESHDRRLADATLTFPPETFGALRAGMICLKCLEPQEHSFEDYHLEGCEGVALHGPTYMKDRQIMDLAMEFEGEKHIGPSKPMSEYLAEQDKRTGRA